jgi:diguanylate cyclase (GGDEF)-like protein
MWIELHRMRGATITGRQQWQRRDGSLIWLDQSIVNRPDRDGDESVFAIFWDATDRIAQEQALKESKAATEALARDFQLLADQLPAAVFRCDRNGVVSLHNTRWQELTAPLGAASCLQDLVSVTDRPAVDALLHGLAQSSAAERQVLEVNGVDGESIWQITLQGMAESQGASLVGSVEDVSQTVQLRRDAHHDPLTGLLNRGALVKKIRDALAADPDGTLVLFIDLDGFKSVNDTLGHDAGDSVLVEVARRLAQGVRPTDVVARYGGDEFVVVCTDAAQVTAAAISHRLTIALGGEIAVPGGTWQPAASIGWAVGRPGDDVTDLLQRADREMFDDKRSRTAWRRSTR